MLNTTGNIMLNKMCHRYPIVNIFHFRSIIIIRDAAEAKRVD